MKKPKLSRLQQKHWESLSPREKEAAFEELDRIGADLDKLARPLTKAERDRLKNVPTAPGPASRRRGRPKLGGVGAKNVLISVEPSLLQRADEFAKRKKLSRSALFSRALELALAG
jgi:hypothetical protein